MLKINELNVSLDGKNLLSNININIPSGARCLLSGHNGSGKSTLAQTIAGNPAYSIDSGTIIFDGTDITQDNTTTRALRGIFLGAQNVPEISGLTVLSFLKHSRVAHTHFNTGRDLSMAEFLQQINEACETLDIPKDWLNRYVNVGFSGGERKKLMLLQLVMTKPRLAILDEPDSGADAKTQNLISETIKNMPDTTFIIISHQADFSAHITPDLIITLSSGKIVIK